MATLNSIEVFLSAKNIAVVGVSRTGLKFGYSAFKQLRSSGHNAIPVNSNADSIMGNICYHSLTELKNQVDAALIIVPPVQAVKVVHDALNANIKNIWFQPGSESKEALELCERNGVNFVHKQCILMHLEPVASIHKIHRFINKVIGLYPR
ncbi:MAG: CoA-binding protein [Ignavibacteriaceae bacterium]|nr:CoA-binding protein [Ignavibacteriaceae bacterium]